MATTSGPVNITPRISLDLRLRFLESILTPGKGPANVDSVCRRVAQINAELARALESESGSEAVRRFVATYELNEPLLTVPPVPTTYPDAPADLSPAAKVSLILEAESEIRALERDLREIEILDKRGVVAAGKLPEVQALHPELTSLKKTVQPPSSSYANLESRAATILDRYTEHISTLSEMFVSWNDIVCEAEETVTRLEKQRNRQLDIS